MEKLGHQLDYSSDILPIEQFQPSRRYLFQVVVSFVFSLITILILPSISYAQEDTWTRKADMPTAVAHSSASTVDGKIYVIGPYMVGEYDAVTDTWTKKADMPTPRPFLSTSVVNGKIYAIGGEIAWIPEEVSAATVEEYNPVTDKWTKKASMPTPRWGLSTSVVGGRIYAIGGHNTLVEVKRFLSTVEEYNPATDTWTKKADMPTARRLLSTSVVDGKIYAIGGHREGTFLLTVEEYDPVTDTWTKKADMPTARFALSTSVVNKNIYAIGGASSHPTSANSLSTVEEYNPAMDKWTRNPDMPTPKCQLSTSAWNGYIYAIGGVVDESTWWSGIPIVEEYDTGVGIRVALVSHREGRVTGGDPIAIFGSRFPPDAIVTIGGTPLTELKVTNTLITGITPPGTEGEQEMLITAPSLDFTVFAGTFIYLPLSNIVVTAITPTNGKQAGGNRGSITGSGFLAGATVTIGSIPATDVVVSSTLIIFTIPPGAAGAKDVIVTNSDGQKKTLRGGYTYNPFPTIERLEPRYGGPLTGGTSIAIIGSNFMPGVFVMVGSERIGHLDFFSPTELRLKTPSGTTGPKDMRVVNPDGQEAVLKEGFTYNPPPAILSVSPNMGPLAGGTEITIIGTGFLPHDVIDILIGEAETHAWSDSSTKIKAKTPQSSAGPKSVAVINPDGQEATLENAFTYNPLPQITRVIPDNGRLSGGTKITIRGRGFLPKAKVLIRTGKRSFASASSIQVMSPVLITAVNPSGEPGPKDVVVRNPDRQEIVLQDGFTYNPMPKITDVSPNHGPTSGGTKIIIRGTGFLQGAKVIIGKRPGTAQVQDDTTIEAVTPKNPQGVFDVRVINPDTQETIKHKGFLSVGEVAYNYPNPFSASQGTTFRYVTNDRVDLIKVQIFNLGGKPVGVVGQSGSNEVRWYDASVHVGLYVYLMEVKLDDGKVKKFKRMLEVYK